MYNRTIARMASGVAAAEGGGKRRIGDLRAELRRPPTQQFEVLDEETPEGGSGTRADDEETLSVYHDTSRPRGGRRTPVARASSELAAGYPLADYVAMRTLFELNHFYDICTDRVVEVTDGVLLPMKSQHAETWLDRDWRLVKDASDFLNGYRSFYKVWSKDPLRRCARSISRVPTTNPDAFYVPFKFAWTKQPEGDVDAALAAEQVALYGQLVDAAAAANAVAAGPFIHDYVAHMLQFPLVLPGVALILTGPKGCGKDTLLNFVLKHLLGTALGVNYDNVAALFNTHDTGSMHVVAVKVEELSARALKPFAKPLRALITAEGRVFNTKNGAIMHNVENYVRFMGTSNEDCPVPMYDDNQADRRFLIARMSPALTANTAFWSAVYHPTRGLMTAAAGRAVGQWLMARDLAGFNPRQLPETQEDAGAYERSPLQMYVEDGWDAGCDWVTTKGVWLAARDFCKRGGVDPGVDLKDVVAVGRALAVYVSRGVVSKSVGHARTAFYRLASVSTEASSEEGGELYVSQEEYEGLYGASE